MTQPGETAGYALADHLRAIQNHALAQLVDYVVANRQTVSPDVARRYRAQGAEPVAIDLPEFRNSDVTLFSIICWMSMASFATITNGLRSCCWKNFVTPLASVPRAQFPGLPLSA